MNWEMSSSKNYWWELYEDEKKKSVEEEDEVSGTFGTSHMGILVIEKNLKFGCAQRLMWVHFKFFLTLCIVYWC